MRITACVLKIIVIAFSAMTIIISASPAWAGQPEAIDYYQKAQDAYNAGDYGKAANLLQYAFDEDQDLIYQYNRILALQADGKEELALNTLQIYEAKMLKDGRFADVVDIRKSLTNALKQKNNNTNNPQKDPVKDPQKDPVKDPQKDPVKDPQKDPGVKSDGHDQDTNILGWALIGTGAPVLLTGIIFGSGKLLDRDSDDNPSDADQLKTHKTVAAVGYIGGALLIGAGITTFLLNQESQNEDTSSSAWIWAPYINQDGAGATVVLSF